MVDLNSNNTLVDSAIGNAYSIVRDVAVNLKYIRHLSANLQTIYDAYGGSVEFVPIEDIETLIAQASSRVDNVIWPENSSLSGSGIERFPGITELREKSFDLNLANSLALVLQDASPNDFNGTLYIWNSTSKVADNGVTVIKPNDASASMGGRWIAVLVSGINEDIADNINNLSTLLGVPVTDVDLGEFTGNIIPDNQPVKPALQALETKVEANEASLAAATGPSLVGLRNTFHVADYGAVGDDSTDDSADIQAAITAANGSVLEFDGTKTYIIESPLLIAAMSDLTIKGNGATIKCGATRIDYYFLVSGSSTDITFEGINFDMRQADMPTYLTADYNLNKIYNCCISVTDSTDGVKVLNCNFDNLYTSAIYFKNSSSLTVDRCKFTSLVQPQDLRAEHIGMLTFGGMNVISNCRFENAAHANPAVGVGSILYSGMADKSSLYISDVYSEYAGRDNTGTHRVAALDGYNDLENVHIIRCICENNMGMFMRLSALHNGSVRDSKCSWNANAEFAYAGLAIEGFDFGGTPRKAIKNILIDNVFFEDISARLEYTVGINAYDWGAISENITVSNCRFAAAKNPVFIGGPFRKIRILNNSAHTVSGTGIRVIHNPNITSDQGTEANSFFEDLIIDNNHFRLSGTAIGMGIDLYKVSTTTATVGKIQISNNTLKAASSGSSFVAIACQIAANTLRGETYIINNRTKDFIHDWYIRGSKLVVVEGNVSDGATGTPYLDDGSNGSIRQRRNHYADADLTGTVTLSSGGAGVGTAEIRTGDKVIFHLITASGTIAAPPYVSAINNGVSFTITAGGSDNSTYAWEILH